MVKGLEDIIGKKIIVVDREFVEERFPFEEAREKDVSLLVPGDPLTATTHVSLILDARKKGIPVGYIPGISILTAAPSLAGLQHYRFGKTVTIPSTWREMRSYEDRIMENIKMNAHTLLLVDTDLGKEEIVSALSKFKNHCFVLIARAFQENEKIIEGTLSDLQTKEWGEPPFTLILVVDPHPVEKEFIGGLNEGKI